MCVYILKSYVNIDVCLSVESYQYGYVCMLSHMSAYMCLCVDSYASRHVYRYLSPMSV